MKCQAEGDYANTWGIQSTTLYHQSISICLFKESKVVNTLKPTVLWNGSNVNAYCKSYKHLIPWTGRTLEILGKNVLLKVQGKTQRWMRVYTQDVLGQRSSISWPLWSFCHALLSLGTALPPLKALIIVSLKMAIFSREALKEEI